MKCTHPFMSKLFAPKFLMRFKFLQGTQLDHSRLRRSGRALPPQRPPSPASSLPPCRLVESLGALMFLADTLSRATITSPETDQITENADVRCIHDLNSATGQGVEGIGMQRICQ